MLLADRVAIVTGGATGMGRGIAVKFAEEGCAVVVCDINEREGKNTRDIISKKGGQALFVRCDVTNNNQIQEMVGEAIDKFGKIDILINNAGGVPGLTGFRGVSLEDINEEQWDRMLNLNLTSHFLCCKEVVPHMKKRKYGKIVSISSMGAVHPRVAVLHYHAAKAGVLGLMINLALDLAPYNICVNAVVPGPIRTEFYDELLASVPDKDAVFTTMGTQIPLRRVGTPGDIAGVALFLSSELSSYMTGSALLVAGGEPLPAIEPNPEARGNTKG
jgi:NAD(P)-dependent dehydrogenase (short-subunit alcohol dehydrogenase family)